MFLAVDPDWYRKFETNIWWFKNLKKLADISFLQAHDTNICVDIYTSYVWLYMSIDRCPNPVGKTGSKLKFICATNCILKHPSHCILLIHHVRMVLTNSLQRGQNTPQLKLEGKQSSKDRNTKRHCGGSCPDDKSQAVSAAVFAVSQ